MASTIFVTGATGQTGGNVCQQLLERGDHFISKPAPGSNVIIVDS